MKWYLSALLGAIVLTPGGVFAQTMMVPSVGRISTVESRSPTTWAMSGMEMIHLTQSDGAFTPMMRSLRMDARTVEILSRTQAPPLNGEDIHTFAQNGHEYVVVRRYLLAEVLPRDARAEGTTVALLARKWARSVRWVLPQVAPTPNPFGI